MSYDLMVFAAEAAPSSHAEFLQWYETQTEWSDDRTFDDPDVAAPALRAWFMEMIRTYPAIGGPLSSYEPQEKEGSLTDYGVGKQVIYAAFAWSEADAAYKRAFALAAKHGVGLFEASSEKAEVWLPDGKGGMVLSHSG